MALLGGLIGGLAQGAADVVHTIAQPVSTITNAAGQVVGSVAAPIVSGVAGIIGGALGGLNHQVLGQLSSGTATDSTFINFVNGNSNLSQPTTTHYYAKGVPAQIQWGTTVSIGPANGIVFHGQFQLPPGTPINLPYYFPTNGTFYWNPNVVNAGGPFFFQIQQGGSNLLIVIYTPQQLTAGVWVGPGTIPEPYASQQWTSGPGLFSSA